MGAVLHQTIFRSFRRCSVVLTVTTAASAVALAIPARAQVNVQINVRGNGGVSVDRDPLVDTVANGKGRINYSAGVIKATGYGAPSKLAGSPVQAKLMAMGAAKADALRNLAMAVSSIQVTATTKVRNYVLQSDVIETKLESILQSPRVVSEKFQKDGMAVVIVELPMYGEDSIASVVLPEVLPEPSPSAPALPAPAPGTFKGPDEPAIRIERPTAARPSYKQSDPGVTPLSDSGPFSAVIIDCRGHDIQAVMSPKLFDTTGREVYGTVRVSPEYAIETGIVGYPRSMGEALAGARAGSHPLIIKAVRAADKFRFHPVISLEDADRILAANNRDHFLERTAVVFLVDPIR